MDEAPPSGLDPAPYTRFPDILRSWFWRFYDHLGHLILYNLLWFFGLWILIGVAAKRPPVFWPLFYLLACAYSTGWAYLVFRVFVAGSGSLRDVLTGFKRFWAKALILAVLFAALAGLGFLNLGFYKELQGGMRMVGWVLIGVTVWILLFWTGASLYQWPLLFFQSPPLKKILYRSFLLFLDNSWTVLFSLLLGAFSAALFTLVMVPWAFLGPVFFFSFQCVALEKHLLRYKITFEDVPLSEVLERMQKERRRSWREFFRPWEAK